MFGAFLVIAIVVFATDSIFNEGKIRKGLWRRMK